MQLRSAPWALLLSSIVMITESPCAQDKVELLGLDPIEQRAEVTRPRPSSDWLLRKEPFRARIYRTKSGRLVLGNGLIQRVFVWKPAFATVGLWDLRNQANRIRAVRPEAELVLDGKKHSIGGLIGQPNHAFLAPAWLESMRAAPSAFRAVALRVQKIQARLDWKRVRHAAKDANWPPKGLELSVDFASDSRPAVLIRLHYALFDGIPAFSKWLTVENQGKTTVEIDRFSAEILALVEEDSDVEHQGSSSVPPPSSVHVETDYAFGSFRADQAARHSVHYVPDPEYLTQVNYRRLNPCLLRVEPTRGPDQLLSGGKSFESFRAFVLLFDGTDRERRGLSLRKLYRTVAPWVTENPLILHVVSVKEEVVKTAIDQAAECGFELISLSFGSGLNMEDERPERLAFFEKLSHYARSKGLGLGGYSLLSSRRIGNGQDVVSPKGEHPTHGNCPALTSKWGQEYFRKLRKFFDKTGFLQFTHDGSYPGDFDVTARPPLQRGLLDSQWAQWRIITDFYKTLRAKGVYLRVPDYYYLSGANECGMGYRETNWSLPRAQQVIHTRQNIYDGSWEKTPSMGWMFVPLTQYHGGGAAATIEPLDAHQEHYRRMLDSNLGMGVQAVYRGHRLYDTDRVRDLVKDRVAWYKRHREVLESDLIHGRRADAQDLDWMLHANPGGRECGMLVVYNPLSRTVRRELSVDLYYTGLRKQAWIQTEEGEKQSVLLDRSFRMRVAVEVPAGGMRAYSILR